MEMPLKLPQLRNDRPLGGFWPKALPAPSKQRALIAFVVAGISDIASIWLTLLMPVQLVVDVATALALWGLLGWRWPLLPALIAEAIPVLSIFPTWTMVAGAYVISSRRWGGNAAGEGEKKDELHGIE